MRGRGERRNILHIDLDPFIVGVERSLAPELRGRPVVIGGDPASGVGFVAAVSDEARATGISPGQPLSAARRLCPEAAFRAGDLQAYARVGQDVTSLLLGASRRVERPSADEAFVDLTRESASDPTPVAVAETLKDMLQRRLGLDAALGLASSRLAARVASRWARPRGFVVVLPGYEHAFVGSQPVGSIPDLPPHLEHALRSAGYETLGQVAAAEEGALAAVVGPAVAPRLVAAARGRDEEPVAVAAPPTRVQEEAPVRTRHPDRATLEALIGGLVARAVRRLRPFDLLAGSLTVEVKRGNSYARRSQDVRPGLRDEDTARKVALSLARPLLPPASLVRALRVRLTRLAPAAPQATLFPGLARLAR